MKFTLYIFFSGVGVVGVYCDLISNDLVQTYLNSGILVDDYIMCYFSKKNVNILFLPLLCVILRYRGERMGL